MDRLRFCLNDEWLELSGVAPTATLLRFLRDQRGLTGTKEGCAEGDCGACTVALLEPDASGATRLRAVNSCLVLLPMLQGKRVYTVEGLADRGEPHPIQKAIAEENASQCGYCTPGVAMSMLEAAHRDDLQEEWQLESQLCGNLCRCTGYRPIRAAANKVLESKPDDHFARALRLRPESPAVAYAHGAQRYLAPATLDELFAALSENPGARIVAGGTDFGLEVTKRYAEPPLLVSLEALDELRSLEVLPGQLRIGAAARLSDVEDFVRGGLPPLEQMLRYFGSRQIKNRATAGGNLCTASPIGDLAPVFIALGAQAVLRSRLGERRVAMDSFFTGYRKTALAQGEILASIEVPLPAPGVRAAAYKVSKRRELDISTASAAFFVATSTAGHVTEVRLAYGGMAPTPARARHAEEALRGRPWDQRTVAAAAAELARDFQPISDHRGSAEYRALVAKNLLLEFFEETLEVSR